MPQERGNWKPYNLALLERTMAQVFSSGDIQHLNKYAYQFITSHMGFIAHYDLYEFRCSYAGIDNFRSMLQASEYSHDSDYNIKWADRYEADRQFNEWYGAAYCRSVADGIRRIVAMARQQGVQPSLPFSALDEASLERG